jgi:prevent-host-death family protein
MRTLGIAELRDNISEILHEVEQGEIVEVTRDGQLVARLVPARGPGLSPSEIEEIIADMDRVAAELGAHWPAGVSARDAIDDVRG